MHKDRWWLHNIASKVIDIGEWLDQHAHPETEDDIGWLNSYFSSSVTGENYKGKTWTYTPQTCCDGACDKTECGCSGCTCA